MHDDARGAVKVPMIAVSVIKIFYSTLPIALTQIILQPNAKKPHTNESHDQKTKQGHA